MTTIYLMRHGQTYFNLWHKIQGWTDSPLTEEGIKQAKEIGRYFRENNINFDKGYSSTSERASDTLELATDHQLPYRRLKGLKEEYFGSFEAEDERLNPPVPYEDFFVKYGGESEDQVKMRMHDTMLKIARENADNSNILIVSHAGAIFNFLSTINMSIDQLFKIGFTNASVAKIEFKNDQFKVVEIINKKNNKFEVTQVN
ncbi:histidine phosphatase family protein [Lactobacillus acidophilus]|uniref:histidine phosphatase family protein n=1 Tax=Lactobacillus acidophilus TaxID=1579 RepID=UPI000F76254C|nr:histidine phosphatase family protein [Lactobacillus acidophilus]AZN76647.1 histidine phosphatase family protein [Lactobacillus acidophilus]